MSIRRFCQNTLAMGLALSATASYAGIITVSSDTPIVDGADIANDNGSTDAGGNGDPGHIWSDRPHQGQTFLTGSNAGGYELSAITLKNLSNTRNAGTSFNILVGTIAGPVFTQIGSTETAVAPNFVPGDYITFSLDTPLALDADTTYAFLWGTDGAGFIPTNNLDDNTFAGGTAISSGDNNTPDLNNVIERNLDRVFHLDIAEVPEPGTIALLSIGMVAVLGRRKRSIR
jgi:hypothetical protein